MYFTSHCIYSMMNQWTTVFTVLFLSAAFNGMVADCYHGHTSHGGDDYMCHEERPYNICSPKPYNYPVKRSQLKERFYWRTLDYAYPSEAERQAAIAQGDFIPENNIPTGIDIWNNKMFICVPRLAAGVPSVLNYLPLDEAPVEQPKLVPYPDWAAARQNNCDAITTTYRIRVDRCDRLWVLDSGKIGNDDNNTQVCPFTVNVYDLHTNQRIRKYQLKDSDTKPRSLVFPIAVDVGEDCEDAYLYACDEEEFGMVVYSWAANTSWRIEHRTFWPHPLDGLFAIDGITFQWYNGPVGVALSLPQRDGGRHLWYSLITDYRLYSVSTQVLKNNSMKYCDVTVHPSRGPGGHVTSIAMTSDGILFLNMIDLNAVGCWNTSRRFSKEALQLVAKDDVRLVFPIDVVIDRNDTVWVISDKLSTFSEAKLNYSNINFRVFSAPARSLIAGTVCD